MEQIKKGFSGVIILLVTAMIWGFSFVGQVLGSDHLPPFGFNALRFFLGGVTMLPLCFFAETRKNLLGASKEVRKRKHRITLLSALLAGCALFAASTLQQCGITMTRDPGKAGFITGLYTVLTPVAYWLIFKKKSSWNVWTGCILAAVGLYMICLKENFTPYVGVGELLILGGAFMWTAHILIVDHFVGKVYALRFSMLQYIVSGGLSLLVSLLSETMTWDGVQNSVGALFVCGVLSVGVAFTLQTVGQRRVPPAPAAIILSTEAVFATVGGVFWNLVAPAHLHVDQTLSVLGFVGCGLMFAGIILSQIRFKPPKDTTSPSL